MLKLALPFCLLVAAALPAAAQDRSFIPRLISAIEDYTGAYRVCLVRTIGSFPVAHETPEQIAAAAMATCERSDAAVVAAAKRINAFPSVANFMDGTSERIFALGVKLARNRIASR